MCLNLKKVLKISKLWVALWHFYAFESHCEARTSVWVWHACPNAFFRPLIHLWHDVYLLFSYYRKSVTWGIFVVLLQQLILNIAKYLWWAWIGQFFHLVAVVVIAEARTGWRWAHCVLHQGVRLDSLKRNLKTLLHISVTETRIHASATQLSCQMYIGSHITIKIDLNFTWVLTCV